MVAGDPAKLEPSSSEDLKGTTDRVLALLMLFAEQAQGLSGNAIAAKLGIGRATTYRMLSHLQRLGMVDHLAEDRLFVPGPKLHRLAFAVSANDPLLRLARREARALAASTGESVTVALYDHADSTLSWAILESGTRPLGYTIQLNKKHRLVWGASGRAILSALPRDVAAEIIARDSGLKSIAGDSLPSKNAFLRELDEIAARGFAASLSHVVPHAFGIASPIMRGNEHVVGAIALSIPEMHAVRADDQHRHAPAVMAAARRIYEALRT